MESRRSPKPPIAVPPIVAPPRAAPPVVSPPPTASPGPPHPNRWKQSVLALGTFGLLLLKFAGKLKFILIPLAKFFPVLLKTGGSMVLTIGLYALSWGWWFALGFVLLIFVHECGHLLAARRIGLKVGAPVFIPFMGALIALKEAPRNAWIEAQVGIGGPLLGTIGAAVCDGIYGVTGNPLFRALAFSGFFLNLFNLAPLGFLDGGRIVSALSPWFWLVGLVVVTYLMVTHFNILLLLILLLSLPRVLSLFRRRSDEERRYFEVTSAQRWTMGFLYFGLITFLVLGMTMTHIPMSPTPAPTSVS